MPWIFATDCSAFADGDLIGVVCGDTPVALIKLEDDYFALFDRCTHQGAPLSRGCKVSDWVECPLHFALFDIRTGTADGGMTTKPVKTYPVKLEGDAIYIDLPA